MSWKMSDWKVSRTITTTLRWSEYRCSDSVAVSCRRKLWSFGIWIQASVTETTWMVTSATLARRETLNTGPAARIANAMPAAHSTESMIPYRTNASQSMSFPSRSPYCQTRMLPWSHVRKPAIVSIDTMIRHAAG